MKRSILNNPRLVLALLTLMLGGCGSSFSDFGFGKMPPPPPPPNPTLFPDHYREKIAEFVRTYLDNPSRIRDASITEPVLRPVAGTPHYVVCVRYNPRNSSNQYEGLQTKQATFLGGNLVQFLPPEGDACNGLAFQRFPALETMVP